MVAKLVGRALKDTAFSIDRLFVWAIAIYGLIGMVSMAVYAYQNKSIPAQIQSATMFCIGCLAARIEGWGKNGSEN